MTTQTYSGFIPEKDQLVFAFYKGRGNLVDRIIRWGTRSIYSHVELIFPDGQWFSTSTDEFDMKVRFAYKSPILSDWEFVIITVGEIAGLRARLMANQLVGRSYDWVGILFSKIFNRNIHDKDRYSCDEVCAKVGRIAGIARLQNVIPNRLNPGLLHQILTKKES